MTEHPILFSAPMVRALLAGTKVQTRRVLKDAPSGNGWHCDRTANGLQWVASPGSPRFAINLRWDVGDKLWVREQWSGLHVFHDTPPAERKSFVGDGWPYLREDIWYWADGNPDGGDWERPRPSIHMPRWASRLTLTVTDVRVERVQDISEADAIAEGLITQEGDGGGPGAGYKWTGTGYHGGTLSQWGRCFHIADKTGRKCSCNIGGPGPARCAYRELWNTIHAADGPNGWVANPRVSATTFSVERAP